jgi:hypothetical protein
MAHQLHDGTHVDATLNSVEAAVARNVLAWHRMPVRR